MRVLFLIILLICADGLRAQNRSTIPAFPLTRFEASEGKQTPEYHEIIGWWKQMDKASPFVKLQELGATDAGHPLHLALVSTDQDFDIASIKKKKKTVIFIINGIHPGEPDGIDASMMLVRDLLPAYQNRSFSKLVNKGSPPQMLPKNVVLAIIPVYNIGGALNRSPYYRVDQNGPESFGFRGNSQNLDLNRDFIKMDSKEAQLFANIFTKLDPDIMVDNHVSNGADYQHVMTLLTTQHNKMEASLGNYLNREFEPAIYSLMKEKGWDLVPYVNHFGNTPERGWTEFWDSPRYSSGYAALWNSFAFVPETHMLKPYPQRVAATYDLMNCFISYASKNAKKILDLRTAAKAAQQVQSSFPLAWKLDRSKFTEIPFKGYTSGRKESLISGQMRLYYDREQPFEKKIPFYNQYSDTLSVAKPKAYIIPQGWWKVVEKLKANHIHMRQLKKDTVIEVESYRIEQYQSIARPFEGHHLNTNVQVAARKEKLAFRKGDWYIPTNQHGIGFLIATLEPQGEDSYFAWNFFDPILGQKEGFSDYVFEETAYAYLQSNVALQKQLEERKAADSSFAKNGRAQLSFIYQNSPYFEPAHMRYPVFRVVNK